MASRPASWEGMEFLQRRAGQGHILVLQAEGHPPPYRDDLSRNGPAGDVYDLAPASSCDLGEEAWRTHLAWGAAEAVAMIRRTV